MKKVYLLITAICLTALTGCIKEEPFTLEEATIEVNLDTRSGTVSEQQGDRIEDVMIWVFKGTDWGTLAGWRTYTPPTTAYAHTSLTLHIPVALCDGEQETYRLVAVLNKNRWGADLGLSSETTYAQLTSMKFAHSDLIEGAITEGMPGTPHTMPVSHWCDVVVTTDNTHASNNCAKATLDVFRSIAKTQLFVTKKSNDFNLVIKSATLKSSNAPTEGMVLSSVAAADLKEIDAAPAWFGTNAPTTFNTSFSQSLKKADGTAAAVTVEANAATYTDVFVGSAFLYENKGGSTEWNVASTNGGYYVAVEYSVDGGTNFKTEDVWLPPVARNHDYQIHATVEAGGKLSFGIYVNEWNIPDPKEYNFQSEISVSDDGNTPGVLNWTTSGNISTDDAKKEKTIPLFVPTNATDKPYATCTFHLATPEDATWRAALVGGNINAFELIGADGQVATTLSGPVGSPAEITIRAKNQTVTSNMEAYLDIVVVTNDGRTLGTVGALCGGYRQKITQIAK